MGDIGIIIISLVLSLAADAVWFAFADRKLHGDFRSELKKYREEMKKLYQTVRNVKESNKVDDETYNKICSMYDEINNMIGDDNGNIIRISKELNVQSKRIDNIDKYLGSLKCPGEDLSNDIKILSERVSALEKKLLEYKPSRPSAIPEANNNKIEELLKRIENLENEILYYKGEMERITNSLPVQEQPCQKENTQTEENQIIIPDKNYIKYVIETAENVLKDLLLPYDYKKYMSGLRQCLDEDDADEIMSDIHGLTQRYVFGSFTKVDMNNRTILDSFLESIGYHKLPVGAGDYFTDNMSCYFSNVSKNPKFDDESKINHISSVFIMPYKLTYDSDGIDETLILPGWCTIFG